MAAAMASIGGAALHKHPQANTQPRQQQVCCSSSRSRSRFPVRFPSPNLHHRMQQQQQQQFPRSKLAVLAASTLSESAERPSRPRRPGERKGFVQEMRMVAMKLHTKDQAKEGEKAADVQPVGKWKPSVQGYLKFLVDNKLVYELLESVVEKHPAYAAFRNTGLERSEALAKDLEWFKEQGHQLPEPSSDGKSYAEFLQGIAEKDPPAFICHFYNYYFAHTAGGMFIGKKVAEEILDGRTLEFYKWEGELPKLLNAVRDTINKVSEEWSREDKDRCLKETADSFKYSGKILRQIIS